MATHQQLRYPHEDLVGLANAATAHELTYHPQLAQFALAGLVSKTGELRGIPSEVPFQWGTRAQYEIFNGHREGVALADKSQFSTIMEKVGCIAPCTTVYRPGDNQGEALERITALDPHTPGRFLKPVAGSRAKGTMQAEDPQQALDFADAERRPYLIQADLSAAYEVRYVLHRDSTQVLEGAPHGCNGLVFYEYQVPFGFFSYIHAAARTARLQAYSTPHRTAFRTALYTAITHSLFASGKIARTLYR
jgi:hypothetical protein